MKSKDNADHISISDTNSQESPKFDSIFNEIDNQIQRNSIVIDNKFYNNSNIDKDNINKMCTPIKIHKKVEEDMPESIQDKWNFLSSERKMVHDHFLSNLAGMMNDCNR